MSSAEDEVKRKTDVLRNLFRGGSTLEELFSAAIRPTSGVDCLAFVDLVSEAKKTKISDPDQLLNLAGVDPDLLDELRECFNRAVKTREGLIIS